MQESIVELQEQTIKKGLRIPIWVPVCFAIIPFDRQFYQRQTFKYIVKCINSHTRQSVQISETKITMNTQ